MMREDTFATRQALLDYAKRYVTDRDMTWTSYYETVRDKVLVAPEGEDNGRIQESID